MGIKDEHWLREAIADASRQGATDYRDGIVGFTELYLDAARAGLETEFHCMTVDVSYAMEPGGMSIHAMLTEGVGRALADRRFPHSIPLGDCHLRQGVGAAASLLAAASLTGLPILDGEVFPLGARVEIGGSRRAFAVGASPLLDEPSGAIPSFMDSIRAETPDDAARAIDRIRAGRDAAAIVQPDWPLVDLPAGAEPLASWLRTSEPILGGRARLDVVRAGARLAIARIRHAA